MALDQHGRIDRVRGAVEVLVDRLAASRPASAIAILIVALCCFLPGLDAIPPIDREETSFAEAAKRMVASGDYSDIQPLPGVHQVAPIGMYWLEAASFALLGGDAHPPIWVFRLPAFFAAIGAALLTWWMALAFGRPRAALLAGVLIAASIVVAGEARLARADGALLAAIVLAEGALARLWLRTDEKRDPLYVALFWGAIGLGILLKGPIAPLALALTVAVLAFHERGTDLLRRLRPAWGAPLMLLVVLPWIVVVLREPETSGGALDVLTRFGGELDPRGPPGSYALGLFAIFFPAAPFFLIAIPWLARQIARPAVLFGVAWGAPFWLVNELFPTKLPHLMLPAFPAITLLTAIAIDAGGVQVKGWLTRFLALGPILWPLIAAIGVPVFLWAVRSPIDYAALVPLVAAVAIGALASHWLRRVPRSPPRQRRSCRRWSSISACSPSFYLISIGFT